MNPRIQELIAAGMQFPNGVTQDMELRVNSIPDTEWPQFVEGVRITCTPSTPVVLQYVAFQFRTSHE
jgi:hypothetical protein